MEKIPKKLIERLEKIYSKDDIEIINRWFSIPNRKTSFRVNTLKTNESEVINVLNEKWLKVKKVDFIQNCFVLENWREKDLWDLEIFKEGYIYLQQITSQIPVHFLELSKNDTVLDVTAAPWSKTSQISALMNNNWKIIANELNTIRREKLKFTLQRQWCKNVEVISEDARNLWNVLQKENFDKILADLPCSAEWKINIHKEKSYWYRKEEINKKNYKLQKDILKSIVPLLKKDWILVYSTCTLAPEENEWIVHFLLSNYPELKIEEINLEYKYARKWIKNFWKTVYRKDTKKALRILPSEETEGFFIAKFIKKEVV